MWYTLITIEERNFPILYGGTSTSSTYIMAFDLDQNGNIAFGGQSSDLTIVTYANAIFVTFYPKSGFEYLWSRQIVMIGRDKFQDLSFSPDDSILVGNFMMPFTLVVFNAADGSLIRTYEDNSL